MELQVWKWKEKYDKNSISMIYFLVLTSGTRKQQKRVLLCRLTWDFLTTLLTISECISLAMVQSITKWKTESSVDNYQRTCKIGSDWSFLFDFHHRNGSQDCIDLILDLFEIRYIFERNREDFMVGSYRHSEWWAGRCLEADGSWAGHYHRQHPLRIFV